MYYSRFANAWQQDVTEAGLRGGVIVIEILKMHEMVRARAAVGGAAKALQWRSRHVLTPSVDVSSISGMEAQPESSGVWRMLVAVRAAQSYRVPLIQRAVSPRAPSIRIVVKILGYASCHVHIHGRRH